MENNNPVVNPMSGFIISEATWLTNLDTQLFITLYQPIIGANALALLNTLWNLVDEPPRLSKRWQHNALMSMVNLGPRDLVIARQKLEAVGLVDTWHNTDTLGEFYVYQLNAPLKPAAFFNDDLMSALLLDSVGQELYQRLRKKFTLRKLVDFTGENITKKIMDVFTPSRQAFHDIEDFALPLLETTTVKDTSSSIKLTEDSFDFNLLFDSIKSIGISYDELNRYRNALYIQHKLYQLNELKIAEYIRYAFQLDTKTIDIEKLKFEIAKNFQNTQQGLLQKNKLVSTEPEVNSEGRQDTKTQNIIKIAKQLSPLEFLQNIKNKKNGFVTSNEQQTINQLVELNVLPIEVINILIFYILIGLKKDNITRAYFNSLANTLSQHHITNAQGAIENLRGNRSKKSGASQRYPSKVTKKVEKKPVYKVNGTDASKLTEHDLAHTQAKLAKLKASRLTKKGEED